MIRNVSLVNGQTDRLALPYSSQSKTNFLHSKPFKSEQYCQLIFTPLLALSQLVTELFSSCLKYVLLRTIVVFFLVPSANFSKIQRHISEELEDEV
jgi:hypothetical protein